MVEEGSETKEEENVETAGETPSENTSTTTEKPSTATNSEDSLLYGEEEEKAALLEELKEAMTTYNMTPEKYAQIKEHIQEDPDVGARFLKTFKNDAKKRPGKVAKTASALATGAKGASKAASAAKNTYNSANNAFMNLQKRTNEAFDRIRSGIEPIIFFAILILMHLFEVYTGFSRQGNFATIKALAYIVIWLYAAFLYYKTDFDYSSIEILFISAIAFFIPYLKNVPLLGTTMENTLGIILIFIPVWVIFMISHEPEGSRFKKYGVIYLVLWGIIGAVYLLTSFTLPSFISGGGEYHLGEPLMIFTNSIKTSFEDISVKIKQTINPTAIKQKAEETFNPYTKYYTGTVEKNKQEPIGVFIEDMRSLTQKNYVDQKPIIISEFIGKSFLNKDVAIWPSCRIEKQGEAESGVADPVGPIDLNYRLQRTVMCEYPSKKVPGYYDAIVGANFDFETWAYITYTFVDLKTIQAYYQQNKDINKELGIETLPRAVYTSGPVSIGVSSSRMPIDINTNTEDPQNAIKQRFGFTLGNFWQQGDIKEVNSINVLVPDPFRLEECDPIEPDQYTYSKELDVWNYSFSTAGFQHLSDEQKYDPRTDLRTITCKLILPNKDAVNEVVGFGSKTPVTFVVIAKYNYQLEKKLRLRIEQ